MQEDNKDIGSENGDGELTEEERGRVDEIRQTIHEKQVDHALNTRGGNTQEERDEIAMEHLMNHPDDATLILKAMDAEQSTEDDTVDS